MRILGLVQMFSQWSILRNMEVQASKQVTALPSYASRDVTHISYNES